MSWFAQNFNFTRGDTLVSLIAGIFLVPHIYSDLVGTGTRGLFKAARLKPTAVWLSVVRPRREGIRPSLHRRFTIKISRGRTFPKLFPRSPPTRRFGLVP